MLSIIAPGEIPLIDKELIVPTGLLSGIVEAGDANVDELVATPFVTPFLIDDKGMMVPIQVVMSDEGEIITGKGTACIVNFLVAETQKDAQHVAVPFAVKVSVTEPFHLSAALGK